MTTGVKRHCELDHAVAFFAVTETVLSLTPGPALLFVLSIALRAGARKSLASGILTANTVYFVLSAGGLSALLISSYNWEPIRVYPATSAARGTPRVVPIFLPGPDRE